MASEQVFRIVSNDRIAKATYRLTLSGDSSDIKTPGQFVNIALPGFFLRRPLSVADWGPGRLHLIYKVLGQGTDAMTRLQPNEEVKVLSGLGNGFGIAEASSPLIVGGGVGVVPLFALARELVDTGQVPSIVLGFNSVDEAFLAEEFRSLGLSVQVATADGTSGIKGFVTDALPDSFDYVYACGPTPMLKAIRKTCDVPGQFSLEERMGCGFGACMGCVTATETGLRRVCKEGPVFSISELQW